MRGRLHVHYRVSPEPAKRGKRTVLGESLDERGNVTGTQELRVEEYCAQAFADKMNEAERSNDT
jgi:hypothetical protein